MCINNCTLRHLNVIAKQATNKLQHTPSWFNPLITFQWSPLAQQPNPRVQRIDWHFYATNEHSNFAAVWFWFVWSTAEIPTLPQLTSKSRFIHRKRNPIVWFCYRLAPCNSIVTWNWPDARNEFTRSWRKWPHELALECMHQFFQKQANP